MTLRGDTGSGQSPGNSSPQLSQKAEPGSGGSVFNNPCLCSVALDSPRTSFFLFPLFPTTTLPRVSPSHNVMDPRMASGRSVLKPHRNALGPPASNPRCAAKELDFNHRIKGQLGLEMTLEITGTAGKQEQTEQGAPGCAHLGSVSKDEISTGSLGHLFCHTHSEQEFSHAQREFHGLQVFPIVPCPVRTWTRSLRFFSWLHSPSSPSPLNIRCPTPKPPVLLQQEISQPLQRSFLCSSVLLPAPQHPGLGGRVKCSPDALLHSTLPILIL